MNSETVFSFRKEELQHSLYSTINTSSNVSVEKHLASEVAVALDMIGPPKNRDSSCCSLSIAVLLTATALLEAVEAVKAVGIEAVLATASVMPLTG